MIGSIFIDFVDPVLSPLLNLNPFLVVAFLATFMSLLITLIYKFSTDQNLMKQLKNEMKELQKEMKELKNNPERMMEVNRKMMQTNSKYMTKTLKSTLITFIPIMLIFPWMYANLAYEPILPNTEFSVEAAFSRGAFGEVNIEVPDGITVLGNKNKEITDNKATWVLKGEAGDYNGEDAIKILIGDRVEYKNLLITREQDYYEPVENYRESPLNTVKVEHEPKKVLHFGENFNLLGYRGGWLGTYIIISIITSMIIRKLLKVY